MFEHKAQEFRKQHENLQRQSEDPQILSDKKLYGQIMKELSILGKILNLLDQYQILQKQEQENQKLLEESSEEWHVLAEEESQILQEKKKALEMEIKLALIPPDPLDDKDIIVEIRAGAGGEEAALFVGDLYSMYNRYAERQGWRLEILEENRTNLGGFKEIVFSLSGKNVYPQLRFESGVHRVQRIPITESNGRIQTSTASVAILPEIEATEIPIEDKDLKIDTFRSSGPGGQSVNTTDSAVRITHLPSGLVVSCQDEKSQLKNKQKALRVLRARLFEQEEERRQKERSIERKTQTGSGDRSQRIRTYNFPQDRLSDHRIGLHLHKLNAVLAGELDEVIQALRQAQQEQQLRELEHA